MVENRDIIILEEDILELQPGTQFLFDGAYNFNIYGTLKATGNEIDSIIFKNFGEERWKGFTLESVSDETVFECVRISRAEKSGASPFSSNNISYANPLVPFFPIA